ncbi:MULTISPECIES: hypothetical protein [unclassified Marinovum]|uniref:hypothetical protein n=1 Tax=unclassified Marinovum TaxID=2647166 RepID=UPI003EDCA62A
MREVITHHLGEVTLTLRPGLRRLTMAGRGRVEAFSFDDIPERLAFYRFLVEVSRTGDWYRDDLAAWAHAAKAVAHLERRTAA